MLNLQDRITISQLKSSADVLNLVRTVCQSEVKIPSRSDSRNIVEEICKGIGRCLKSFDKPCGVAIVQTQRNELLVELVEMVSGSPASYVPAMQSDDLRLLNIERLAAFKLETTNSKGQLTHPATIASELQKIEELVIRFDNRQDACDLLDAMTQAAIWAQDKAYAWAGVAARRSSSTIDSPLEVKSICSPGKEYLDVQFAAIGPEWMSFSHQVRVDHA